MVPSSIRRRLDVLLDALSDLRRYAVRYDPAGLEADGDAQRMVLHALYTASQAAIDLALHMAADREQATAATYQDAFARLEQARLIEPDLARRLAGWAGLRNVLAHQYATLDLRRVDHALRHELGDLERLAEVAARWLDEQPDQPGSSS